MGEQLRGKIAATRKEQPARGLALARRTCAGLEGRGVHTQVDESPLRLAATVAAVKAVVAARTLEADLPEAPALPAAALAAAIHAPAREKTVAARGALEAAEALHDLEPALGRGPGRKLGL